LHFEGLATREVPESCGRARKSAPEALTGAHAGRVLSREIEILPGAEVVFGTEGNTRCTGMARCSGTWRGLRQTPSMRGSVMRENREALWPARGGGAAGRGGKPEGVIRRCTAAGSLTAP
jgi:hypothetical protein